MDFFKKASESFGGGNEADLLKQAKGFMGSQNSAPQTNAPNASTGTPAASGPPGAAPTPAPGQENYSEVYGSAQTLYQGLQDKLSGKQSNIDDQQLAGAAANVLKAADSSGFAKDSQYGEYFNKAETYLQNYGAPKQGAPSSDAAPASAPPAAAPPAPQ